MEYIVTDGGPYPLLTGYSGYGFMAVGPFSTELFSLDGSVLFAHGPVLSEP